MESGAQTGIKAPRGQELSCKGWQQEAALRMLMNNLDAEVAERPDDLIVYGGTGKAARNWECYHAIVASLRELENDETLLVQSGKPVGVFKTHEYSPRVLIANANLVGNWANWDEFNRLEAMGAACDYHDPYFPVMPATRDHPALAGRKSVALNETNVGSYDAVLVTTDHTAVDYDLVGRAATLLLDTRNAFKARGVRVIGRYVKI